MIAIAQGSSELNISFVVEEAQARDAARRVHAAFQLSKIGGGRPPGRAAPTWCCSASGASARALADQWRAARATDASGS